MTNEEKAQELAKALGLPPLTVRRRKPRSPYFGVYAGDEEIFAPSARVSNSDWDSARWELARRCKAQVRVDPPPAARRYTVDQLRERIKNCERELRSLTEQLVARESEVDEFDRSVAALTGEERAIVEALIATGEWER